MLLSAALIVRDEARFLGACLDSLVGLVDDLVVVDTGSIDETPDIARAAGARLFEFAWCDDFSAARNHALAQVRAPWVLYIDADERVRPMDKMALAAELADPILVGATVRFHARTGHTAYPEYRLFRRHEQIRFIGAMHETIVPALHRLAVETGGRIGASSLTIDHVGYDGDQSHKLDRNLKLLRVQLDADPGRPYLHWHLGLVLRDLGRAAEAEAAWRNGVGAARARPEHTSDDLMCFNELIRIGIERGDEVEALIGEAMALSPEDWFLRWLRARASMARRRFAEAEAILEPMTGIDPETLLAPLGYDRRIFGAGAWAELAYCAFEDGRFREAEARYGRAEALAPGSLEYKAKRMLAKLRAGG